LCKKNPLGVRKDVLLQPDFFGDMTQDELWQQKYQEVIDFLETNHRNPSKHRIEEHLLLNFIKHNRKLLNAGKMKADRVEKFNELSALGERYKRKNQYE